STDHGRGIKRGHPQRLGQWEAGLLDSVAYRLEHRQRGTAQRAVGQRIPVAFEDMYIFAVRDFGYSVSDKEQPVLHDLFADPYRGEIDMHAVANDAAPNVIMIVHRTYDSRLTPL